MIFACEQCAEKLCEVESLLFTGKDSCVTSSSGALCYGCEGGIRIHIIYESVLNAPLTVCPVLLLP